MASESSTDVDEESALEEKLSSDDGWNIGVHHAESTRCRFSKVGRVAASSDVARRLF